MNAKHSKKFSNSSTSKGPGPGTVSITSTKRSWVQRDSSTARISDFPEFDPSERHVESTNTDRNVSRLSNSVNNISKSASTT